MRDINTIKSEVFLIIATHVADKSIKVF